MVLSSYKKQAMAWIRGFALDKTSLSGSVGCGSHWWSGGCRSVHTVSGNILSWRLIMHYYLWSFPCAESRKAVVSVWHKNTQAFQEKCGYVN